MREQKGSCAQVLSGLSLSLLKDIAEVQLNQGEAEGMVCWVELIIPQYTRPCI